MAFQVEYFTLPSHYEETPLCDRKQELYDLKDRERKAKFLQHVIALANSARSFGKPARLLFGLDDRGFPVDLGNSLACYAHSKASQVQLPEKIRSQMGQAFAEYIAPELSGFAFELGELEGKRVAYLLIHPMTPPQRFHVKRELVAGKLTLLPGQCWIRFGEHKELVDLRPISPDDKDAPYYYAYAEIPYILPSCWLAYFGSLLRDERIQKAQTILGYQEPASTTGQPMQAEIQRFLESESHLLIVEGLAGVGKTAFLRRQVAEWAAVNAAAMEEIQRREEFRGPPDWIPLLLPLRGVRIGDSQQLAKRILDVIHKSGAFWVGERPRHPEHLLEYADLKWLVCLDGLDEMWEEKDQRSFLGALRAFLDSFPRTRVVLTTRPEAVSRDVEWLQATTVQMAPFDREMILNYVASQITNESAPEYFEEVSNALSSNEDLWYLCSFPVCLEAAMKELADIYPEPLPEDVARADTVVEPLSIFDEEVESPAEATGEVLLEITPISVEELVLEESLSDKDNSAAEDDTPNDSSHPPIRQELILNGIYSRLWERETRRNLVQMNRVEEWWDKTGQLALRLDGQHKDCDLDTARKTLGSKRALLWLLNLGILDRRREIQRLAYRTEMTKTYFAARYMLPRIGSSLDRTAHRLYLQATPDFRGQIRSILEVITAMDLSPLTLQGGNNG